MAHAQPRALFGVTALALMASVWWATAQAASKSTTAKPAAQAASTNPLAKLPAMMESYGRSRAVGKSGSSNSTRAFGLTEVDLTPGNTSDEREPIFSPGGDVIAFASNGADANTDGRIDGPNTNGRYHIWVMNSSGRQQRQVTGLGADANRDQRHPSWSPDGTQLVYSDALSAANVELFLVRPFDGATPAPEQLTFGGGIKATPSWNPSGLNIAFSANVDETTRDANNRGAAIPSFDIFTIDPTGTFSTVRRLTGGAGDAAGDAVDDVNPAFSLVNPGLIYFGSDRTNNAGNRNRRIWIMSTNGGGKLQVSDPTNRRDMAGKVVGAATDSDDYPTPSLTSGATFAEQVGFQSNSLIDASDRTPDLNIWSLRSDTSAPAPALLVASFTGNAVEAFDPQNGQFRRDFVLGALVNPEDIIYGPDLNRDNFRDLYVSNREANAGNGRIDVFDGKTGAPVRVFALGGGPNNFTHPTGLAFAPNGDLYVASGFATTPPASTNLIHRFDAFGRPKPAPGQKGSIFTSGDTVSNGIEGIAFGPDGRLYASDLVGNKVSVYDPTSGAFMGPFVPPGANGLSLPTGITFDAAGNLYVCSRNTDEVQRYDKAGNPNPSAFALSNPGAPSAATFASVDMDGPERVLFGPDGQLYVTNAGRTANGNVQDNQGQTVTRYDAATGTPSPALGQPAGSAIFVQSSNLSGASGLAFTPVAVPMVAESGTISARLESNTTSSPAALTNSRVNGAEDVSADREPGFARTRSIPASANQVGLLVFASQRPAGAAPGTVNPVPNATPTPVNAGIPNPAPGVVNPGGGPNGTHDIWTTVAVDTTPPILIPQGTGNQLFPFLAPGPQAPFPAPRTAETGLTPGGPVILAFVLRERESGIFAVNARFFNADVPRFLPAPSSLNGRTVEVNEQISLAAQREGKAAEVPAVGSIQPFDDGPVSAGGHEEQADAVAGDGIVYCKGTYKTPETGDFYIDIDVTDNAGNFFTYDNIWGFSTRIFTPSAADSDLFVSDYMAGQNFPGLTTADPHFQNLAPVESYLLTNPTIGNAINRTPPVAGPAADAATFGNPLVDTVDVWRIQCRGEVPVNVLNAYRPQPNRQLDPADFADRDKVPADPQRRRLVSAADRCIIWASPYTALVFTGPGTLFDATTQSNLTNFLDAGGRLFVTGRDVVFSLSNQGTQNNDFLFNELQASSAGESPANDTITAIDGGKFTDFGRFDDYDGAFDDLQLPQRVGLRSKPDAEDFQNTYEDAATNQQLGAPRIAGQRAGTPIVAGGQGTDFLGDGSDSSTVTPAYSLGGKTVGQRVERVRTNGLRSRVVFFGFGMEGVNRRYTKKTVGGALQVFPVNARAGLASGIVTYFKTGTISGQVINDATNQPIPNFLVQITASTSATDPQRFLALTDQNGNYQISGLPLTGFGFNYKGAGLAVLGLNYRVSPAVDNNSLQLNRGYFNNSGISRIVGPSFNRTSPNNNLRVIPIPNGTLRGVAVDPAGNALPNFPVLVRSIGPVATATTRGIFAQLVRTDNAGRFVFTNVPGSTQPIGTTGAREQDIPLQLIFNPRVDLSAPNDAAKNDIPAESGLQQAYVNSGGMSTRAGRRVIPDAAPDPAPNRPDPIRAPSGNTFFLNDIAGTVTTDTPADDGTPIVVPITRKITGVVRLNGAPVSGATVELLSGTISLNKFTTGADGSFTFLDLPVGSYNLTATFKLSNGLTLTQTVVVVAPAESDPAPVVIDLFARTVSGTVFFRGQPVNGATVQIFKRGAAANTKPLLETTSRTIGSAVGQYSIGSVPSGPANLYTLRAAFGGATTIIDFEIANDANRLLDVFLTRQDVSGSVTVNGVGVVGITAQLFQGNTPVSGQTFKTVSGGRFAFFGVAPGTGYTVRASYTGVRGIGADTAASSAFDVVVNQNVTGVKVALFLQTVSGRVTLNGANRPGVVVTLTTGNTTVSTKTNNNGAYAFFNVAAGPYTLRATSPNGDIVSSAIVVQRGTALGNQNLALLEQTIVGSVTINGQGLAGASVRLSGPGISPPVVTGANGTYSIAGLPAGTYTLTASGMGRTGTVTVVVPRNGGTTTAPTIVLADMRAPQFAQGRTFMISIPLADNNTAGGTVSVAKAFTSLATENGQTNFQIYRVDPTLVGDRRYVLLDNNSLLRRGEGYFLKTINTGASFAEVQDDPTLKPLASSVREFTVTLRLNPSSNDTSTGFNSNGYNLIGFPFDQANASSIDWGSARVILPGASANSTMTVDQAAAAGKISSTLATLADGSNTNYISTKTLLPRKGYYARTFVDGLKVVLRVPVATSPMP